MDCGDIAFQASYHSARIRIADMFASLI